MKKKNLILLLLLIIGCFTLLFIKISFNKSCSISETVEKKEIKVNFVDYAENINIPESNIYKILNKHYKIIISDQPEYLLFSVCSKRRNLDYPNCVKIFWTEENYEPDFNLCDYAISFENMDYGDRHIRVPNWISFGAARNYDKSIQRMQNKHKIHKKNFLDSKTEFCSFVYSNGGADPIRKNFFESLCSKYKKVNSAGKFLNNIGGPMGNWGSSDAKYEFERKHKFSIAFENSSHAGYSTEKLVDAFAAQTVPIYWGDPSIGKIFNTKAFINVHDYNSIDEVIKKIIEIDNDDKLYLRMIKTPALIDKNYVENNSAILEDFLINIFDQPYDKAFRRNMRLWGKWYPNTLKSWRDTFERNQTSK